MPTSSRTTEYHYNGYGKLAELIARHAATGDQTTTWEYGTTSTESGVASFDLVKAKVYPDGVALARGERWLTCRLTPQAFLTLTASQTIGSGYRGDGRLEFSSYHRCIAAAP